jgi:formylmethanofuran dehydrogenase subunit E
METAAVPPKCESCGRYIKGYIVYYIDQRRLCPVCFQRKAARDGN